MRTLVVRHREALAGAAILLVCGAAAAIFGSGGWPGAVSGCVAAGDCSCEALHGGSVVQPANTLSALGFAGVALWVLGSVGSKRPRPGRGTFSAVPTYGSVFGGAVLLLAVGSMAFHGALTEWGGWLDLVAMHVFVGFVVIYNLVAIGGHSRRWFLTRYAALVVAVSIGLWFLPNQHGKFVFGGLLILALATEVTVAHRRIVRDRRLLGAALALYVTGSVVWLLSRDGGAWCRPGSWLQGHGLWHLAATGAVGFVFAYLCSERPAPVARENVTESD